MLLHMQLFRKGRMLLPAPVPASNLSSEDESPVASSKVQIGGGHLNNSVEDSPTIVMSSKQGTVVVLLGKRGTGK